MSDRVKAVIIIILIVLAYYWITNIDLTDYSKPWFKGYKTAEVCEVDIDSEDDCYYLGVNSDGKQFNYIYFPNGGYKYGSSECYESASFYRHKRFCRFFPYNEEESRYDIIPIESENMRN